MNQGEKGAIFLPDILLYYLMRIWENLCTR